MKIKRNWTYRGLHPIFLIGHTCCFSGIRFYGECGYLLLGYKNTKSTYDVETAAKLGEKLERLSPQEMAEKFPFLSTKDKPHWNIHGRQLRLHKPKANEESATAIGWTGRMWHHQWRSWESDSYWWRRVSDRGWEFWRLIRGKKVLVATGCFTHCKDLLPVGMELDTNRNGTTILPVTPPLIAYWPVADPGFSWGGGINPRGHQHIILPNFPKNCMKLKEFGPPEGGARPKFYYVDLPLLAASFLKKGVLKYSLKFSTFINRGTQTFQQNNFSVSSTFVGRGGWVRVGEVT